MYKFTGFTESANNALNYSVEAAENMGHTYIGSEHLLLGLLSDMKMVSATILNMKKVTLKRAEEQIKSIVGIGLPTNLTPNDITPRCKRIIENALAIGRSKALRDTGTEELLDALTREFDCAGCKVLNSLGVHPGDLFSTGKTMYEDEKKNKVLKTNLKKCCLILLDQFPNELFHSNCQVLKYHRSKDFFPP